jgi:negative regulator of sigma E activity
VPQGQALPGASVHVQETFGLSDLIYPITLTPLGPSKPEVIGIYQLIIVYDRFTDEELVELEGKSRENVIARLNAVKKIQDQLSGVSTQLNQLLQAIPENSDSDKVDKGKQPQI